MLETRIGLFLLTRDDAQTGWQTLAGLSVEIIVR
jgi:hypothetical protein